MATLEQVDKAAKELEAIVDSLGLVGVIQTLSTICHDKVSHLAETWQETDTQQVKTWKHNAGYLDKVSSHVWRQEWERNFRKCAHLNVGVYCTETALPGSNYCAAHRGEDIDALSRTHL